MSAVLDLTSVPDIPSIFDPTLGALRRELVFLNRFVGQISDRARPDWEAVDYVPTQIVTEFFLRIYEPEGLPVSGLIYRSAITGAKAIVLDVPNNQCVEQLGDWRADPHNELRLGLDEATVNRRKIRADERRAL